MNRFWILLLAGSCIALTPCAGRADDAEKNTKEPSKEKTETKTSHSFLHNVAMYIPNRFLDVLDVVRLRVRVGPGVAVDARATKVVSAFAGSYASVYAGLPGPRNCALPKLPVGFESRSGIQASLADATIEGPIGPDYGPTEIGAGVQALLVGVDVGVEPLDMLDLLTGFLFIDLRDDDL
jgi:hypothetical protein